MGDLSITATTVKPGTGAVVSRGIAGVTITAGQAVYIDTTDSNKIKLADANLGFESSKVAGIALNGASAGQNINYQTAGEIYIGATVASGVIYVLSATAGGVTADAVASGSRLSFIGYGKNGTTDQIVLMISGLRSGNTLAVV